LSGQSKVATFLWKLLSSSRPRCAFLPSESKKRRGLCDLGAGGARVAPGRAMRRGRRSSPSRWKGRKAVRLARRSRHQSGMSRAREDVDKLAKRLRIAIERQNAPDEEAAHRSQCDKGKGVNDRRWRGHNDDERRNCACDKDRRSGSRNHEEN